MKTMKLKRAVLMLTLLVMSISAVTGGTIAWFTDSVTSDVNTISAGNLDIEVLSNGTTINEKKQIFVMPELWEPGAVAYAPVSIQNVGNLALYYKLNLGNVTQNTVKGTEYALSDVVKVGFAPEGTATDRASLIAAVKEWKSFAEYSMSGELYPAGTANKASAVNGVAVVYWAPSNVDNNYNVNNGKTTSDGKPLSITFGVNVEASQYPFEKDSFDETYDEGATTANTVKTTENLQARINAAPAGSTLYLKEGTYNIGSMLDVNKSITLVGAGEGKTIITHTAAQHIMHVANNTPDVSIHVVLKDMTLKGDGVNTKQVLNVKYNTVLDLYNVTAIGTKGNGWYDIILDNGNLFAGDVAYDGSTTTVNAYNVTAGLVALNAIPCNAYNPANGKVEGGINHYANFNYDGMSNIGYIEAQSVCQKKENCKVNGVSLTDAINNIHVINNTEDFLKVANGGYFKLERNVAIDADATVKLAKGKSAVIDLNGCTLSGASDDKGSNRNMFDVQGNLTVNNGTVVYEHQGTNMGWGNSINNFNITAGGVLNLNNVDVVNNGGSDMAFCVHMNNWGEVTLNAEDCTFTSPYVAIRVFNSGYDKNNVNLKNCVVKGDSNAFWVHNYTKADFGNDEAKTAAAAERLNFSMYGSTYNNTFIGNASKPSAIRYGFTNSVYVNADTGAAITE